MSRSARAARATSNRIGSASSVSEKQIPRFARDDSHALPSTLHAPRLEMFYGSSRAGPTDKGYTDATDLTDAYNPSSVWPDRARRPCGSFALNAERSTPKHLPHAGGVTVDQKLIHVDTRRCLAIVMRMLCVPTRRVIAATERKIRQRSKRDTIPRGISCGAVDEGADGNNL